MKKDQIKINIEGQDYNVNLEKAIELGVISKDSSIKDFNVGDLFVTKYGIKMIIVDHGYFFGLEKAKYNIIGLGNSFKVYSDFRSGATKDEMIEYLNNENYKFVKNLNKDLENLLGNVLV
jgi:hypothetical protein